MMATSPLSPAREALSAARDIVPLALGVVVYGLAFGLLAAQASMDELQTGVMGAVVFAGSSQIVAVERLVAGAGALAAVVAGLALNLRLMLLTASVRDIYVGRPWWQVALGAHLATDENWALMLAKRGEGRSVGYWYLIGGGATLLTAWLGSTVCGVAFASAVPEPRALGMDFAFAAAFIAIARSLWRGRLDALPWSVAAATVAALSLTQALDTSWALIAAAVLGSAVAGAIRR